MHLKADVAFSDTTVDEKVQFDVLDVSCNLARHLMPYVPFSESERTGILNAAKMMSHLTAFGVQPSGHHDVTLDCLFDSRPEAMISQ